MKRKEQQQKKEQKEKHRFSQIHKHIKICLNMIKMGTSAHKIIYKYTYKPPIYNPTNFLG